MQSVVVPVAGFYAGGIPRSDLQAPGGALLKAFVAWLPSEKRISATLSRIVMGRSSLSALADRTGVGF